MTVKEYIDYLEAETYSPFLQKERDAICIIY